MHYLLKQGTGSKFEICWHIRIYIFWIKKWNKSNTLFFFLIFITCFVLLCLLWSCISFLFCFLLFSFFYWILFCKIGLDMTAKNQNPIFFFLITILSVCLYSFLFSKYSFSIVWNYDVYYLSILIIIYLFIGFYKILDDLIRIFFYHHPPWKTT